MNNEDSWSGTQKEDIFNKFLNAVDELTGLSDNDQNEVWRELEDYLRDIQGIDIEITVAHNPRNPPLPIIPW